jgi:hypothetical protein
MMSISGTTVTKHYALIGIPCHYLREDVELFLEDIIAFYGCRCLELLSKSDIFQSCKIKQCMGE